jgi:hypothetical protein
LTGGACGRSFAAGAVRCRAKAEGSDMRDFFINSLEMLVSVIVILLILAVLGTAAAAAFGGGMMGPDGMGGGGPLAGLAILIGGGFYVVIVGGFLYMGIGIYQNTKRSAEALEKLLSK